MGLILAAFLAVSASAQAIESYVTHDSTTTTIGPLGESLFEGWADVKAPGDGRIYSVGTIQVVDTYENPGTGDPSFSGVPVGLPIEHDTLYEFSHLDYRRQVVIVQCVDEFTNEIEWQRYFYGRIANPLQDFSGMPSNARAISVFPAGYYTREEAGQQEEWVPAWPGAVEEDTRIAICGETWDPAIPRCPQSLPSFDQNNAYPSGFLAVLDGSGVLQWSRLYYGRSPTGCCTITDVSIRVELDGGSPAANVVTYCGMSSHGVALDPSGEPTVNPPVNGTLLPENYFDPPAWPGCNVAGGATDNGPGQWDGIVGRVRRAHTGVGALQNVDYHAVVGGSFQDGLFGLVEADTDTFVVVGQTARKTGQTGAVQFPFHDAGTRPCWSSLTDYCVGVSMVFGPYSGCSGLCLRWTDPIGHATSDAHTIARDVAVQRAAFPDVLGGSIWDRILIVGSTDDPYLFTSLHLSPATTVLPGKQGAVDGFLLSGFHICNTAVSQVDYRDGSFHGDSASDYLTGVACWPEHLDHSGVCGVKPDGAGGTDDFDLGSYFEKLVVPPPPPQPNTFDVQQIRRHGVAATANQRPAQTGPVNAFVPMTGLGGVPGSPAARARGLEYLTNPTGSPDIGPASGGGIAVDSRGRLHVAGATDGAGLTITPSNARGYSASGTDAARLIIDMVPHAVGRSDGTGDRAPLGYTMPAIPAGRTGGTTPTCALLPVGPQIGIPPTSSSTIRRMLIDWEGPAPQAGSNLNFILLDRPPVDWQLLGSLIIYGVPTPPPPYPAVLPYGLEDWVQGGVSLGLVFPTYSFHETFRLGLTLPPAQPGQAIFSVQIVSMTTSTHCGNPTYSYAASPAITFAY